MGEQQQVFRGKVGVQQRVLAAYRVPFLDRLAQACTGGVEVFSGQPRPEEGIRPCTGAQVADLCQTKNIHVGRGRLYFCWQQGFRSWLRMCSSDVVIVAANPRTLSNLAGFGTAKGRGCPVIGWGLGTLDWRAPRWLKTVRKYGLRGFCQSFDAMIAYSRKGADDYRGLGFDPEKIFIASNAVSSDDAERLLKKIGETPDAIVSWKEEAGLSEKPVVLYVGRLIREKRVGELINACSPLKNLCELVIVGDGPERGSLENQARNMFPAVRFMGHRTGEELALCFAGTDMLVLPGSGGLAVQEAMIYGKPVVVASGDGTQRDLVREGENGFHVVAGDVDGLRRTLADCIGDPVRLAAMGRESARIVREECNLSRMVETFVEALNFVSGQ